MHDHASFVDKLGGPGFIAHEITEMSGDLLKPDNVRKWKVNGVPPKWQPHAVRLAAKQNVPLPPDFLGGLTINADKEKAAAS